MPTDRVKSFQHPASTQREVVLTVGLGVGAGAGAGAGAGDGAGAGRGNRAMNSGHSGNRGPGGAGLGRYG